MKFLTKIETFENDMRIWKYYLFGNILVLTKEKTYYGRKIFLFNVCISKRRYQLTYFKNTLTVSELFQKKKEIEKCEIDIVIPVYNGFNYLDSLFSSIEQNTDFPYRLFVVNDCSPDERIQPLLEKWKGIFGSKMKILRNEENLGFVKSVNAALKQTTNHVVLLNTDVVVPKDWVRRLFYPILTEDNVGSVTPFSNSATIFSIPKIGENNDFDGDLDVVNAQIQCINTPYQKIKLPTGVGFCMAMNKNAIADVGILDEIFGKGYGEENDWCQRIIKKGYINTIAADLFVWHKHGGSFISEEKQKLIAKHSAIIKKRYPKYEKDVQKIVANDTFKSVRFIAEMLYFSALSEKCEIWFDHTWGGGTETYTNRQFEELKQKTFCIRVQNNLKDETFITFYYKNYSNSILIDWENALCLLSHISVDKIVLNNLASYFDPLGTLEKITTLKHTLKTMLSFRGHDLFAICPTVNMVNQEHVFCNTDSCEKCEKCLSYRKLDVSIQKWRACWNKFLSETVDEIIVFSQSSSELLLTYYPGTKTKIKIVPHDVPALRKVNIPKHEGINIAFLGYITVEKGFNVLKEMNDNLAKFPNTNLIVIGKIDKCLSSTKTTGTYRVENLPSIMEENNIDIVFIPSICPETFSYTTSEAMMMGLPVACFNLGAPAERVKHYEKGLIIDQINGQYALKKIIAFLNDMK